MTRAARPRLVVTGVGVVCAYGWSTEDFWSGLVEGRVAIGDFDRVDHREYRTHVAAQVPEVPTEVRRRFHTWKHHSLADRFALVASWDALQQAGLREQLPELESGVFFGSSTGGMLETEDYYRLLRGGGRPRLDLVASQQVSAPGNAVAREFGVRGPVQTVSSACASGSLAVGMALDALRDGEVDVAIAGGADSLCRTTYGGFNSLRSIDERPCKPFRTDRDGLSLGEGGAALVLETEESARRRGVQPLAEVAGSGCASDAHHMTAPAPEGGGAAVALRLALEDAGTAGDAIDFVNAHGTGTPRNDVAEWNALRTVLGSRASEIPVTSTKSLIGHLLGSAGSIEAVATVLCLQHRAVHATAGAGEVDPDAPVHLVRERPFRPPSLRSAASLNLGFGGCNAAVVFSRWNEG
jgi:3-oxoacyl-[acyl-carrier-protein] synthase II